MRKLPKPQIHNQQPKYQPSNHNSGWEDTAKVLDNNENLISNFELDLENNSLQVPNLPQILVQSMGHIICFVVWCLDDKCS